jgi:hypothetical protein
VNLYTYVQSRLLGYTAVLNFFGPTFQRCVLPPSSGMSRSTIILHGSITQKTALNIILAAVRTWNLTYILIFLYFNFLFRFLLYYYYYYYEHLQLSDSIFFSDVTRSEEVWLMEDKDWFLISLQFTLKPIQSLDNLPETAVLYSKVIKAWRVNGRHLGN